MKLAIHDRKNSFSDRWIDYCKKNNIEYKLVNCYSNDIVNQLSDCNGLMWHWDLNDYKSSLFAKQLTISLEMGGLKVYPSSNTAWHYDDKVGQKYLLEAIHAPLVPSVIFYTKKDAIEWVASATFPKVFKLRGGAGSVNVRLVHNRRIAKKLIKKAFGTGFKSSNKMGDFKDRVLWNFRNKPNLNNLMSLIKGLLKLVIKTEKDRLGNIEKGYIYFQDFLPNNDFDSRLIVIGNKCFAVRRHNRKNDFRASGSGVKSYKPELFDEIIIRHAYKISQELGSQSMAYDFIYDNGVAKLVEISYCFVIGEFYDNCPGYWDKELNWHTGPINPQNFIIEDFIHELEKDVKVKY